VKKHVYILIIVVWLMSIAITLLAQQNEDHVKSSGSINYSSYISAIAVVFSAITAAISAGAAFYTACMYRKTHKLMIATERPVIDLRSENIGTEAAKVISDNGNAIDISTTFKNVGKHPAEEIKVKAIITPMKKPDAFKKCRDISSANQLFPEATIEWFINMQDIPYEEMSKTGTDELLIYILINYRDGFNSSSSYQNEFFIIYSMEHEDIRYARLDERKYCDKLMLLYTQRSGDGS